MTKETNASAGHDSTQAGRNVSRFEGLVMHPFLSRLIFSRRLRGIVKQLVNDNDFRAEGVYFVLRRAIAISIILIFVHVMLAYWVGFLPSLPMMLVLWAVWIWLMSGFRERVYILSTIGVITKGKIEDVWFGSIRIPVWFVKYKYRDHNNREHINELIYNCCINKINISKNNTINVIYECDSPENGVAFSGKGFWGACLSKKRYEILGHMKRLGEEG